MPAVSTVVRPRSGPALVVVATVVPVTVLLAATVARTAPAPTATGGGLRVVFSTYLGGSAAEELREVIVDADGSVLTGGITVSADMPVTEGAFQTKYGGEPPGTCNPGLCGGDMVIARLAPDGRALRAATFLGGSKQERNVYGMALDRAGDVVVTSSTRSLDMPTTAGAYQPRYAGGDSDIVVAKLSADLSALRWCSYLGGSAGESPRGGLALDDQDRAYIVGPTGSADFPTTAGAYRRQPLGGEDGVIARLAADGSALEAATRLGGSSSDGIMGAVIDPAGDIHIVGHTTSPDLPTTTGAAQPKLGGASDTYAAGLTGDLGTLLYATYLGGAQNEFAEHRVAWRADGTLLFPGVSASADYPTTAGAYQRQLKGQNDGLFSQVSARDGSLVASTLLGGSGTEFFLMPTEDAAGNVYLVGTTTSTDFPVTADALQPTFGGGAGDGVLVKMDATGSRLLYATYVGGSGDDLIRGITIAPDGSLLLVGRTTSADFPVTAGAFQPQLAGDNDGFVVKLSPEIAPPTPTAAPSATATREVPSGTALYLPAGYRR